MAIIEKDLGAANESVDWRGIGAFVFLNFGPSWIVWFWMMARGVRFDAMPTWAVAVVALTMWFPGIAALVVRTWITKEGMATAGFRFGPWRPYVAIALGMPVLFGLIYGLSVLLGFAHVDVTMGGFFALLESLGGAEAVAAFAGQPLAAILLPTLIMTVTVGPIGTALATAGEEIGWTGYLLPKLMPLGKWRATLLYGLIWGLWHAPIVFGGYNYPGYPVLGIGMMCLAGMALALPHAAVRLRYQSVWLTTWLHACINTQARGIWVMLFAGVHPLFGGVVGLTGLVIIALVGVWMLAKAPDRLSPS